MVYTDYLQRRRFEQNREYMPSIDRTDAQDTIEVTRDLLMKYDLPGPRYTSYPTVPEWRKAFGATAYAQGLQTAGQDGDAPLSVYTHIPFCRKRCYYCGCNTAVLKDTTDLSAYLDLLEREIVAVSMHLGKRHTIRQLHWGGGTPTTLSVDMIERLFGIFEANFRLAEDAEIALEVDPRVTTNEQIQCLRGLGFNRISMGVQDLDPCVQSEIGREQTEEQTRRLFAWCRDVGFGGINADLIYGLPAQTVDTWTDTIRRVIDIGPDRLAVYSFAHLPKQLPNQQHIDASKLPTGPEKYELFAIARRLFLEAGYRAIGMDHFARPRDELSVAMDERRLHRNFMGYTVVPSDAMAGIGASAIGEIGGCYAQNAKDVADYAKGLDEHGFATVRGCTLSEDDTIRRWVIRQLMCNFYLDVSELERRFGVTYEDYFAEEEAALAPFYADAFLKKDGDNLEIMPLGQIFVRNVAMVFDAYLKKSKNQTQFSRTV